MRTRAPYELFRVKGSPFWYVYLRTRDNRRVRKSTKETTKERAHAVAREWERLLGDPTYHAAASTTLSVAADNLVEHLANTGRAGATRQFYSVKLSQLGRILGADLPLANVSAALVDDFIKARKREGASRHTIAKELTALRMLLKVARRRGEFDRDPGQVLPVGFAPGYTPRTRRVSQEEALALIAALPGSCGRYAAFVCATTARDAAVHRALGKDLKSGFIFVRDRKTALATRRVPVVRATERFAAIAFEGVGPEAQVAPGIGSVRHAFDRAAARLGMAHLSPNDLRRSVAHWLLEGGVARGVAAAFMGHSSTKMLDAVYGRLDAEEIGAAIERDWR